jgi:hypothetical protein
VPYRDPDAHSRDYGAAHRRERARWRPIVAAGGCACVRCGRWISATQPWDLDHDDDDRTAYRGPAHRSCNRAAGAAASNRARRGDAPPAGRDRPLPGMPGTPPPAARRRPAGRRRTPPDWPATMDGGPDDPRRGPDGVMRRAWGEW